MVQLNVKATDLLWKAPELLRNEALLIKGTPYGDVYAFGIIMQEVLLRGEPYCMLQLSHQEILSRLRDPPPMIRPSVRQNVAPPDAINVMKQCWAEIPEMRPDFNEIHETFKKLNMGRRQNIVDTMFQMLEKYSSNLEDLIKERTEQLDVEKKKTEQLLNRMLPSSVADQLKLGMQVAPEEFDEVTIYFSDIVGFTTISAYSTPFEVVDLLNDLYTSFDATIDHYNVYKVTSTTTTSIRLLKPLQRLQGAAWRIHISEQTAFKLRESGDYHLEYRGRTQIKGKGLLPTYWLLGKDDFKKELPKPPDIGHDHGLDEELIKQGRQHYTTRRDSVVEAMSAAKFLSQAAAQAGVSGISLSRGNSFNRPLSRNSGRYQELPTICDSESPVSRRQKSKLSPLQQSPDSDSPGVGRTNSKKKSSLQVPTEEQVSATKSSKPPDEASKALSPDIRRERVLLPCETAKISSASDTSRESQQKPTVDQMTSAKIEQLPSVRQKLIPPTTRSKNNVHNENEQITNDARILEQGFKVKSKEYRVRTKHQSTNIPVEPITSRHHKTSSSSDMSRKSNDKKSIVGSVKVCKPGSGCRGRMAQTILPHSVPTFEGMLACAPNLYGDPYVTSLLPHPYHISPHVKTLPKSKERTNVYSRMQGQSLGGTTYLPYNTIPRPSRYASHLPQVISHPVFATQVSAIPPKRNMPFTIVHAPKLVSQDSKSQNIVKRSTSKPLETCNKTKSRTNPDFPPDIRTLTESTML
ncbi:uncharacterized protein LOC108668099 [Hyalella azteca]|uniref:guanylate cyclase n=1 Tax=Hyalella azteca TaxID=294128 RepID=A0A8B7NAW6_HYAAZ|nr:uncharacterized protein LOC108668099 [Hyalella azteca]